MVLPIRLDCAHDLTADAAPLAPFPHAVQPPPPRPPSFMMFNLLFYRGKDKDLSFFQFEFLVCMMLNLLLSCTPVFLFSTWLCSIDECRLTSVVWSDCGLMDVESNAICTKRFCFCSFSTQINAITSSSSNLILSGVYYHDAAKFPRTVEKSKITAQRLGAAYPNMKLSFLSGLLLLEERVL